METQSQRIPKHSKKGIGSIEVEPCHSLSSVQTLVKKIEKKSQFSKSEVCHLYQTYPFGFRTPENCSNTVCRWIYPITYGGGLVGGDHISVNFSIGQKCSVVVCTQEATKVYHCLHSEETTQILKFKLQPDCLLCVLPDPLVCYRDARFFQKQTFHISPSSNLVLLDWLQSGRKALGESWHFQRYCSNIEIYCGNKLILRECNDLENTGQIALDMCMKNFQIMGTCIVLGPYVKFLADALENKFGCKKGFGEKNSQDLVVSVSPLSYCVDKNQLKGCYLRFLATDIKAASIVIKDIYKPLLVDLGADPFERKL